MALKQTHQESNVTQLDRYPQLYAGARSVADAVFGNTPLHLLVLGCSTGEEPFTLAQRYFTKASHRLYAGDIAQAALDTATSHYSHPRIRYFNTSDPPDSCQICFQLVFANSMLCRWPASRDVASIATIYPFTTFEAALAEIDQRLAAGGLLAVYNANYRLSDTAFAARYLALRLPGLDESGFVTKFDPDGRVSSSQFYPYSLFLKVADAQPVQPLSPLFSGA